MMISNHLQETTISEVEGEEGNFLAGPEWKVALHLKIAEKIL